MTCTLKQNTLNKNNNHTDRVKPELLLTYSEYNPKDAVILIARAMVITCVTLSAPLLHYPVNFTYFL